VSQLLTLYITPVYYVYIEGARLRLARRKKTAVETHRDIHGATTEPALAIPSIESGRGSSV
jgi:hypothetical protein